MISPAYPELGRVMPRNPNLHGLVNHIAEFVGEKLVIRCIFQPLRNRLRYRQALRTADRFKVLQGLCALLIVEVFEQCTGLQVATN